MRLHLFNSAVIVNSKMDYSHLELEIFSELSGIRILLLSNSKVCTNNNYCCCRSGVTDCAWRRDELRFPSNLTSTRCTMLFILCAWKKIFTGCESQPIPSCKCRELQTVQRCQQETISTVLLDTQCFVHCIVLQVRQNELKYGFYHQNPAYFPRNYISLSSWWTQLLQIQTASTGRILWGETLEIII